MQSRINQAVEKKRCLNCAQAVLCTYADLIGISEETACRLAAPFGSGMATMDGTCGAIVGAGMVVGLATPDRAKARESMRFIMNNFQARNGATQCRQLKGVDTKRVLRECSDCVADAAEFLEKVLIANTSKPF